jgi:hypothetical protein
MSSASLAMIVCALGCSEPEPCADGGCVADGGQRRLDASAVDASAVDASAVDAEAGDDGGVEPPLVRSTDFAEASSDVLNPDRGFYWWDWNEDASLVLVKVQLGDYCDVGTLPDALIDGVRDRLGEHRDAGRRAIVRFVYADDGDLNRCGLADAESVELVEGHVAQLAPIFAEHADVIAFVEAGFFGMWGEWNSEHAPEGTSLWDDQDNRRRVLRALLDAVPAELAILVRRPRFRDELPFSAEELARIGFHNDCFLASSTDSGTYESPRTPDEWKTYVRDATTVVPIGGETCNDDPTYTICANAIEEMERLRFDYLHEGYSGAVIDRWRDEGCLDEIRRRLGYRIVLRAVELSASARPGGALTVRLELENLGFAPPRSTRRFRVVLRSDAGVVTLVPREQGPDTRGWLPGTVAPFELVADLPDDLPPGEHELRVVLLDDSSDAAAYALLFANDDRTRDDARRENVVGHLIVE